MRRSGARFEACSQSLVGAGPLQQLVPVAFTRRGSPDRSTMTCGWPMGAGRGGGAAGRCRPWPTRGPNSRKRNSRRMRSAGVERTASDAGGSNDNSGVTIMTASSTRQGSSTNLRRSVDKTKLARYSSANRPMITHSATSNPCSMPPGNSKRKGASPRLSAASARNPIRASLRTTERRPSMSAWHRASALRGRGIPS